MNLFDRTFLSLERSLDYSSLKNRLIADNISNVDTPGYKAKTVSFKDVLAGELDKGLLAKKTHIGHRDFSTNIKKSYAVHHKHNTTYNHNGNNVDIDKVMSELAKNQIYYQALVDRLNGKFGKIQAVLRGGA